MRLVDDQNLHIFNASFHLTQTRKTAGYDGLHMSDTKKYDL